MLVNGLSEFISFASLFPFLNIITDPENILGNKYLNFFAEIFQVQTYLQELILVSSLFIITIIFSSFLRIINIRYMTKISALIGNDFGVIIYKNFLFQDYKFHINNNTSKLSSTITFEIDRTTNFILLCLQFIAALFLILFLILGFLSFSWQVGVPIIFLYFSVYLFFVLILKNKLIRNSKKIVNYTENQVKALDEGFDSIRDILLDQMQNNYIQSFRKIDYPLRDLIAKRYFYGVLPKFILESFGIILIIILSLFLVLNGFNKEFIIDFLGGIAVISQKLLPSLQICYSSWSNGTNFQSSVEKVINNLNLKENINSRKILKKLKFNDKIELKNICYKYKDKEVFSLRNIDFKIYKGQKIGIIGETGSGKSTFLDILMGLLLPQKGSFLVDGVSIYSKYNKDKILSWQNNIAHVPQSIYLSDNSFAENIAFGKNKSEINMEKVKEVAKLALISSFIESYPNQYEANVGERGIKLSGGQRQRIGIARALYKNAEVLILDEATSALDNKTEANIMESINNLKGKITIIIVAHRLTTLKNCDQLIELKKGFIEIS